MTVIEKAEARLQEEIRQNDLGADNGHLLAYWAAYLDGARAQRDEAEAQLPKRGEIVRCKECIHFTQGGWCDREFDWFPVDENDFCSMAEKMEVQE